MILGSFTGLRFPVDSFGSRGRKPLSVSTMMPRVRAFSKYHALPHVEHTIGSPFFGAIVPAHGEKSLMRTGPEKSPR